MAIELALVDDLDSSRDNVTTMRFVYEDTAYAIELSEHNAAEFHATMQRYADAGRKLGRLKVTLRDDPAPQAARSASSQRTPNAPIPLAVATAVDPDDSQWYRQRPTDATSLRKAKAAYRKAAREFARANGIDVPNRGLAPSHVFDAYDEWCAEQGLPVGPASVGVNLGSRKATG